MSIWSVTFYERYVQVTVRAAHFVDAVNKAVEYAKANNIPESDIRNVEYLGY